MSPAGALPAVVAAVVAGCVQVCGRLVRVVLRLLLPADVVLVADTWSAVDDGTTAGTSTVDRQADVSDQPSAAQTAGVATKTTATLIDDLDPDRPADETVQFSLDGAGYEIDLSAEHADQLREHLASYVGGARRVGGPRVERRARPSSGRSSSSSAASAPSSGVGPAVGAVDTKAVREWAKARGKPVNERGRIASSLLIEFQQAQHD